MPHLTRLAFKKNNKKKRTKQKCINTNASDRHCYKNGIVRSYEMAFSTMEKDIKQYKCVHWCKIQL